MKTWRAGLVIAVVACGTVSLAIGCSSSSDTGSGGTDAATGGGDGSGGGDGGGGGNGEGGHEGGTVIDSGGATSGFGAACTGPDGTTGAAGGCTDAVYNLCATVGPSLVCTKACTYPGGSGMQPDPTDCPNPPTSGNCTPRGFCK